MDWALLPLELLEAIFQQLCFKDRLQCSLVCHNWNQALFECPTLARSIVFSIGPARSEHLQKVIPMSERNYRQLAITLSDGWNRETNDCLKQAVQRWNIGFISLVGEPNLVRDCFQWNGHLFNSITELNLEFTLNRAWPAVEVREVELSQLKKMHYLQVYTGSTKVNCQFRFIVPKMEDVSVVLDSLANEEAMYWEDPLIELTGCVNVRSVEIDLNGTMWESFFAIHKPHMERLIIRRAIDEYQSRDWDCQFTNMPNLRHVEFTFANNDMLACLNRHCKRVERLQINGFCLDDGNFVSSMQFPLLRNLHMDGWFNGSLFSNELTLRLDNLEELTWKYVELAPVQDTFTLITPKLKRLTLRGCEYVRFHLDIGNRLVSLDMDYYGVQMAAPMFLDYLDNLQHLILHINGRSSMLVQKMCHIPHVKRLEVVCSTESHGYDCNALLESMSQNFLELEEFVLRNEHENQLSIDYGQYVRLSQLRQLKTLTLQYITIRNVTGEIGQKHVPQLNVWGCSTLGVCTGTDIFSSMVIEG
ncbi:uncharacterized protein LOC135711463 [Ochlerotatus camptorhynchus]|uniref:uncharacterized protein LOC135711463 n=1 Tax=Ochlerotatus camptorhynchus TaxID=644619 RepID=UPI0031D51D2C